MKEVTVLTQDGKVLAHYPIILNNWGSPTKDSEYIDVLKGNLLDDKLATEDELEKLVYQVAEA